MNTAARVFDISNSNIARLENEIADTVSRGRGQRDYAPPSPLPDYVKHHDGANEIGMLSAEALVREYEETAKEVEAMGDALKQAVARAEQLASSASDMLAEVKAVASRYREEGKRIFEQVEAATAVTEAVRKTCADMVAKLGAQA